MYLSKKDHHLLSDCLNRSVHISSQIQPVHIKILGYLSISYFEGGGGLEAHPPAGSLSSSGLVTHNACHTVATLHPPHSPGTGSLQPASVRGPLFLGSHVFLFLGLLLSCG